MAKDFTRRGLFLMDEGLVDFLYEIYLDFNAYTNEGTDPMYLLLAISDYCVHGEIRDSLAKERSVVAHVKLLSDRLDSYIQTLREKGLAPATFKEWGE